MQTWIQRLNSATKQAAAGFLTAAPFASGASAADLAALEQQLGTRLPEDFKQLYLQHNGCNLEVPYYLLAGYEWLSTERILAAWQNLCAGYSDDLYADVAADDNDVGVRPVMYSRLWLPFAEDNGYYLLLDLDPAPAGHYGQITLLSGDGEPLALQAASMTAWLQDYVQGLERGEWVFSDDYQGMIRAEELAEYEQIEHEQRHQIGRFDPEVVAAQRAQAAAANQQALAMLGELMPKGSELEGLFQDLLAGQYTGEPWFDNASAAKPKPDDMQQPKAKAKK
ncbi:SMI1/KNR4 family protein [Vitreoscilla massiliensis]|uniref:SMI1/KNR4 family protein n=1 Tax=Vitreoscilla massiliensis TaxID=1689272 RepID=A0ABY4E4Z1_9NEIS|nr:SMI1/KNR4 family protein [Vitreoscilla massiliensis]UOO89940.1 SMI1/KNR4 family protein [Vitreoscilla massiliensis]